MNEQDKILAELLGFEHHEYPDIDSCVWFHPDCNVLGKEGYVDTPPPFSTDANACLWAWERVMELAGDNATAVIYSLSKTRVKYRAVIEGRITSDIWVVFDGYGAAELEARVACMITVLNALKRVR